MLHTIEFLYGIFMESAIEWGFKAKKYKSRL